MKYLFLVPFIVACTNLPQPTPEPEAPKQKTITEYANETYPVKGWHKNYDEVIAILQKQTPIEGPCQSVTTFLKGIISAESNFNNASIYREPPPLNQNSIGFFQLSLTDKAGYACNFSNEKDIQNPILNIECAYKILNKLKAKNPTENIWEYGGRYWSCLRDSKWPKWKNKNQSGVLRVKKFLKDNGCLIQ